MLPIWFDSSKMDDMTTFEMTVLFDSDSEEAAVGAVDSLGDAFSEHLTGWAASVKSTTPGNVQTFKSPTKLIDMPEIIEMAEQQVKRSIDLDIEGNDPEFIVTERLSDQEPEVGDPAYEDPEDAS